MHLDFAPLKCRGAAEEDRPPVSQQSADSGETSQGSSIS